MILVILDLLKYINTSIKYPARASKFCPMQKKRSLMKGLVKFIIINVYLCQLHYLSLSISATFL